MNFALAENSRTSGNFKRDRPSRHNGSHRFQEARHAIAPPCAVVEAWQVHARA
jgi:hypothetical protein